MKPFVHLHVHSQYSLLDGQASISALIDKALDDNMAGIALTDHGNMFGVKELYNYVNGGCMKGYKKGLGKAEKAGDTKKAEKLRHRIERITSGDFKIIIGCEMYVANGSMSDRSDKRDIGKHLVVLAKNKTGYKNLIKLVSKAWTDGFYTHPRTDKEELVKHREGLIIASACLGGEIPRLLREGRIDEAEESIKWWKETFGDDYYLELQRHKTNAEGGMREVYEIQQKINPIITDLARKYDIKLIATNDVHFVNESDAEAHDRLICVSTNSNYTDLDRMRYTKQEWMKTQQEMNDIFSDIPEALENTLEILNKVEKYSIDHGPVMPTYAIPEDFGTEESYRQQFTNEDLFSEFTQDENGNVVLSKEKADKKIEALGGYDKLYRLKLEADYLKKLAYEGAKKRYGDPLPEEIDERIKFELHIMKTMGFPGYFLIVQDFIKVGREQLGVSIGPGRGSAAGSAVAYCLGITQIDPIKYDLLFERFLNPDRISLPDIDIDFDDDGRADVLHYVTKKYGEKNVAHIITYGTMAAKSAIKDVARIHQLTLSESERLTKLIPKRMPEVNGEELKPTLDNCLKHVQDFKNELNSPNPLIRETLRYANELEGNVRNTGVHACGVIICRDEITDWVPVSTAIDKASGSKERIIVTQYEGKVIEETGLIKMDFLGLKTLSIIKEAIANIKRTTGKEIDIDTIPIDDPKTYQLYCEGKTIGTFQFESAGMQKYLRELQPSTFEDLIAMNALYRPGPMEYIPDFIDRKHGKSPIVYDIPIMEKYLKDTYGITVYQEQVMLLSRQLANFTRGQSDNLRKAMGKKLKDKMAELEKLFLEGGQANGHNPEVLRKIWTDWEKFASYAFNKSHATCYSWIAYQTAWLKANYPAEYMAAVLTRNLSDITKLTFFMEECKRLKITVKGPDVNESFSGFSVNNKGEIRFGLAAIKGMGESAVDEILKARENGGTFKDIYDFAERVPGIALNRRVVEGLAYAGAFDCFQNDVKREDFFEKNQKGETFTEALIKYGQMFQADKKNQSLNLFGDDPNISVSGRPSIVSAPLWIDAFKLEKEKELVGMYYSSHPLDPFFMELTYGMSKLKDFKGDYVVENTEYIYGGLVVELVSRPSKTGGRIGFLKLEDFSGSAEIFLKEKEYYNYANFGVPNTAVYVKGTYSHTQKGDLFFIVNKIGLLNELRGKLINGLTLTINRNQVKNSFYNTISDALVRAPEESFKGSLSLRVFEPSVNRCIKFTSNLSIPLTREMMELLEELDTEVEVEKNYSFLNNTDNGNTFYRRKRS